MSTQTTGRLGVHPGIFFIVGLLAFIIAWFLPAYKNDTGYDAYMDTYESIFNMSGGWEMQTSIISKIAYLSAAISPHTNYLFIFSAMVMFFSRQGINNKLQSIIGLVLLFSFLINLVWIYGFKNDLSSLGIGYYLWAFSFFIVSFSAFDYIPARKRGFY
jgi:hypothetical protein